MMASKEIDMASITVRNLDDDLKAQLRLEAARQGRSMEEQVRVILRNALSQQPTRGLGTRIHQQFAAAGGVALDLPSRADEPRAASFDS